VVGDMVRQVNGGALEAMIGNVPKAFGRFFRWWRQELIDLLPHFMKRMLGVESQMLLIDAASQQLEVRWWHGGEQEVLGHLTMERNAALDGDIADLLRARATIADEVILQLSPEQVMQRDVTLPLATKANLREVLGFEIDRLTPFQREAVVYDYDEVNENPAEGTLRVRLYVVQRNQLEGISKNPLIR